MSASAMFAEIVHHWSQDSLVEKVLSLWAASGWLLVVTTTIVRGHFLYTLTKGAVVLSTPDIGGKNRQYIVKISKSPEGGVIWI